MTEKKINPADALKKENAKLRKEIEKLKEDIKTLKNVVTEPVNPKANTLYRAKLKKAGVI